MLGSTGPRNSALLLQSIGRRCDAFLECRFFPGNASVHGAWSKPCGACALIVAFRSAAASPATSRAAGSNVHSLPDRCNGTSECRSGATPACRKIWPAGYPRRAHAFISRTVVHHPPRPIVNITNNHGGSTFFVQRIERCRSGNASNDAVPSSRPVFLFVTFPTPRMKPHCTE